MKKILFILITVLFLCTGCTNEESYRNKFDQYIEQSFGNDNFFEFDNIGNITVGSGISVKNTDGYTMFVYPVYENDKLINFIELTDTNGELGFAYPSNLNENVLKLFEVDSEEFVLFVNQKTFWGYAGDTVFDFRTGETLKDSEYKGKLPKKEKYDNSIRMTLKIPEVKGNVDYTMGSAYELSDEETIRFIKLLRSTTLCYYAEVDELPIGFIPQYKYSASVGFERYGIQGYEPLGAYSVISNNRWCSPNPYGELFDFNREMMIKYDPEALQKVSDAIYETVIYSGFTHIGSYYSDTFSFPENGKIIDWGVWVAPDACKMSEIFAEFGIQEESELTLSEYFALKNEDQINVNDEIQCESFRIKLVGKGERGTFYYIKSEAEQYKTSWGYVLKDIE